MKKQFKMNLQLFAEDSREKQIEKKISRNKRVIDKR